MSPLEQSDRPLNDIGEAQARALGDRVRQERLTFDRAYSSDLSRARKVRRLTRSRLS
jgi:probable phosphoglycerate mutase